MTWSALATVLALAMMMVVGALAGVGAQGTGSADATPVTTAGTFSGRVTKAGSPLTVRGNDGVERSIALGAAPTIIRDGKTTTADQVQVGDQVNVTTGADGAASRVEATSNGGAGAACTAGGVYSGDVTKAGNPLTVRGTDGQERTVAPAANPTIIRDGKTVGFADLHVNDKVNVTTNADCTASRVEASSTAGKTGIPGWVKFLPLLLIPLIALPLLLRRRGGTTVVRRETTVAPIAAPVAPVKTERVVEREVPAGEVSQVVRPEGPDVTIERVDSTALRDERDIEPRPRR